jgi:hypothetical protein
MVHIGMTLLECIQMLLVTASSVGPQLTDWILTFMHISVTKQSAMMKSDDS